jgi:predicted glutamine amidotransferase
MCLLTVQPAGTIWTPEHIADFYQRNQDGLGVMWAEEGSLHYTKVIVNTPAAAVEWFQKNINGKACAWHARMRTHGNTDMENCHPYNVFGFDEGEEADMPMLLMHNGILHTGNSADTTKSDTWHYVKNYIRVLLKNDPALAFSPEFAEIIGKHIGQNRFVLMNHQGDTAVINKSQGVTFNGAWLSNEYAWSAHKYIPRPVYVPPTYYGKDTYDYGKWNSATKKWEDTPSKKPTTGTTGGKPAKVAKYKPTKHARHQQLPLLTNTGGKTLSKIAATTLAEVNESNGVSVDCKWLDDVLELRSMVDAFYVFNQVSNKNLECMIEEMGVTKAYLAVELLGDGLISEKSFDNLTTNRTEMRYFKDQPMSTWYPDTRRMSDSLATSGSLQ